MRESKLALKCAPIEPDSLLLEQMTMLAASSTAPLRSPWWQRALTKSGAAAIAGVLALSGAAYAERAELAPIMKSMTGISVHHAVRHHAVRDIHPRPVLTPSPANPAVNSAPSVSHAGHPNHGRRVHGFHSKPGKGAGWMKNDRSQGGNQSAGDGLTFSRETQNVQNGNAQGRGNDNKTGQNNASHGSSAGNSYPKGASNPKN